MVRRANRGSNKNDVPSWQTRLALNTWMLAEFGDGLTAPCAFCGRRLFFSEITRDRFPKPGHKGGRYIKGNIRPACLSCNASDGARQLAERKRKHKEHLAKRRAAYAERKRNERLRGDLQGSEDRADAGGTLAGERDGGDDRHHEEGGGAQPEELGLRLLAAHR